MASYRTLYCEFWEDEKILENFTPEDKYFWIYILTNPKVSQIGVYKFSKKIAALQMGYNEKTIEHLLDRFINFHKLIIFNEDTFELCIKNWGRYNLKRAGKPVLDCINSDMNKISDKSLIKTMVENSYGNIAKYLMFAFNSHLINWGIIENGFPLEKSDFRNEYPLNLRYCGEKDKIKKYINNNNIYIDDSFKDDKIIDLEENVNSNLEKKTKKISSNDCSVYKSNQNNLGVNDFEKQKSPPSQLLNNLVGGDSLEFKDYINIPPQENINNNKMPFNSVKDVLQLYKENCNLHDDNITSYTKMSIEKLIKQGFDFEKLFNRVNQSDFLLGKLGNMGNKKSWKCDLNWIMKPSNTAKILLGKYDNYAKVKKEKSDINKFKEAYKEISNINQPCNLIETEKTNQIKKTSKNNIIKTGELNFDNAMSILNSRCENGYYNSSTRPDILKMLKLLTKVRTLYPYFKKDSSKEDIILTAESWSKVLNNMDLDVLFSMLYRYASTNKFPPGPADLNCEFIKVADSENEQTDAEIWDLHKKILANNYFNQGEIDWCGANKALKQTMRAIGFHELRHSTNTSIMRAQMLKMYHQIKEREQNEKRIPQALKIESLKEKFNLNGDLFCLD